LRVIAELALKKEVSKICVPFNLTDRNTIVQGFLENYLIFNSSLNQYEGKPKELVKIKTNVICKM
jgi:predicted enzyme involved in methoxymalonyl-ACP biosynthesis